MPPRIPTEDDFSALARTLPHELHFPSPRESTTAILVLLHGLGDSEAPFARFARAVNLPGVLTISVRGVAPLPPALLLDPSSPSNTTTNATSSSSRLLSSADRDGNGNQGDVGAGYYHWGDDVRLDPRTGDVDPDPGFDRARRAVLDDLVRGVLMDKCGWDMNDVLLFGFGQGGSLALGIASHLRVAAGITPRNGSGSGSGGGQAALKGVVSIGGPLPTSMIPTTSTRGKSATKVLVCQLDCGGDEGEVDAVKAEFRSVTVVRWRRGDVAMPRDREEMFPIMKFFAERLKGD